jgi:uncharacterized protein
VGLIYLDACLLIYACESHPGFGPAVKTALAREPAESFAVSPLTRMECLVKPIRTGNFTLQRYYEDSLECFTWLSMNDAIFDLATQLRARHGLRTPDALHLACAQQHGCTALWTNDDRLAAASHGLAINVIASQTI